MPTWADGVPAASFSSGNLPEIVDTAIEPDQYGGRSARISACRLNGLHEEEARA
jgi:hypothetical protein